MSVTILAPLAAYSISSYLPFIAKTCILVPPEAEPEPEDDIFVPTPPGVTVDDLPELDTVTQIIDTSPEQIIGCANKLPLGKEQVVLNAFFPNAVEGDGVVNRGNNDIWVYRSNEWQNVGPTPGPQVVVVTVVPPSNEILKVSARTRTFVEVSFKDYALELITLLSVATKTSVGIQPLKIVNIPSGSLSLIPNTPSVRGGAIPLILGITQETGTRPPLLGAGQVDPVTLATDDNWELLFNDSTDEQSFETTAFGFDFTLNNIQYDRCFVNSNQYLTFGGFLNAYQNLSQSVPVLPKIHFGARNNSLQRLYVRAGQDIYRIRWEGNSNFSAPAGSSNRFIEVNFFKPLQDGTQYVEIRSGNVGGTIGVPLMIATASTALATGTFAANQSWVLVGNATGTSWTITSGQYINYSLYIGVEIPATYNQIVSQTPLVSIVNVAPVEVPSSTCSVSAIPPVLTESGVEIITDPQNVSVQGQSPLVSSGVSANIPSSSIVSTASNQLTIGRIAHIDIQSISVTVEEIVPTVSTGASVVTSVTELSATGMLPAVAGGAPVEVPASSVTPLGIAPMIEADAAPSDPNFSSVSLLLHMDGSNGSTTFTDSSSNALAVTASGSAQISAPDAKWGTGALRVVNDVNTLNYITTASSSLLSFPGDFTIEMWVKSDTSQTATYKTLFELGLYTNGILFRDDALYINGSALMFSTGIVSTSYRHIALTRSGSTVRLFYDGASQSLNATLSGTINTNNEPMRIGASRHTGGQHLNCYIDDVRITKGVARYTANFTPPTAAFPDS